LTERKTVDGYVAGLGDWRGDTVRALIDLVSATAPDASGSIKWAQPVFELDGPAIWLRAYPRTVSIGFWRGAEMDDRHGLLLGEGDRMRHVTFRESEPIPSAALADYITQALELNRRKGDPTRRGATR
jgi:hypothetical protein